MTIDPHHCRRWPKSATRRLKPPPPLQTTEAVSILDEFHSLGVDDLKRILAWVIGMNGEIVEIDGELRYYVQSRNGITLEISLQTIEMLVEELRVVTVLSVSSDPAQLADLLASVAIIVGQTGPKVTRPATAHLAYKLGAEFGVASAAYLARSRGYQIELSKLPWHEIYPAIHHQSKDLLTEIFQESLGIAQFASATDVIERMSTPSPDHDETKALMLYFENQFTGSSSLQSVLVGAPGRELSAESYWNLRSVAEMEDWDSETVLSLIDEHLYPSLRPEFVYHNVTVSGSAWLRLYIWLCESGGDALWRPTAHLPQKS